MKLPTRLYMQSLYHRPYEPCLIDCVGGVLPVSSTCTAPKILLPALLRGFQNSEWRDPVEILFGLSLCLVFCCGSLLLLPSTAGGSISDNNWARDQSEYSRWPLGIILLIFLCPRSVGYPASGSWSFRRCLPRASFCGIGIKLDQSLVGHFHKFCASITPTHLPNHSLAQDMDNIKPFGICFLHLYWKEMVQVRESTILNEADQASNHFY